VVRVLEPASLGGYSCKENIDYTLIPPSTLVHVTIRVEDEVMQEYIGNGEDKPKLVVIVNNDWMEVDGELYTAGGKSRASCNEEQSVILSLGELNVSLSTTWSSEADAEFISSLKVRIFIWSFSANAAFPQVIQHGVITNH